MRKLIKTYKDFKKFLKRCKEKNLTLSYLDSYKCVVSTSFILECIDSVSETKLGETTYINKDLQIISCENMINNLRLQYGYTTDVKLLLDLLNLRLKTLKHSLK